jgi:membrane peptidoglycan carboxypeptidase
MIQVSSNVGAAKLALKWGADAYSNWLKTLGFGVRTGIGFPGEIAGKVPPRKVWQPLSLANIGFGQGVLVTPMQMLRSYAVFANGGYLVQPTLLKNRLALKGLTEFAPQKVLSPAAAAGVTEALLSVTTEGGTGLKANVEGYRVAGKTGTAQAVDPNTGRYSRSRYISSFIGYPVGVEPKLVILTMIDEPKGVYYASETAAPLFQAVLRSAANRFSLPTLPSSPEMTSGALAKASQREEPRKAQPGREGVTPLKLEPRSSAEAVSTAAAPLREEPVRTLETLSQPEEGTDSTRWKMPDLRGFSAREALLALQKGRFELEVHGEGVVKTQVPAPGQQVAPGSKVSLRLEAP